MHNPKHPVLPWLNSAPSTSPVADYNYLSGIRGRNNRLGGGSTTPDMMGTQCVYAPSWGRVYVASGTTGTQELYVWDVPPDYGKSPVSGGGRTYTYFTNAVATTVKQWTAGAICYDPSRDSIFFITYTASYYSLKSAKFNTSTGFDDIAVVKTYANTIGFGTSGDETLFWCPYNGYLYSQGPTKTFAGGTTSGVVVIDPSNGTVLTSFAAYNWSLTYCTKTEKIFCVGGPRGQYGGSAAGAAKGWCAVDPSNNSVAFYTSTETYGNFPMNSISYNPRRNSLLASVNYTGTTYGIIEAIDPATPSVCNRLAAASTVRGTYGVLSLEPLTGDLSIVYTTTGNTVIAAPTSPSSAKVDTGFSLSTYTPGNGGITHGGHQSFFVDVSVGLLGYSAMARTAKVVT